MNKKKANKDNTNSTDSAATSDERVLDNGDRDLKKELEKLLKELAEKNRMLEIDAGFEKVRLGATAMHSSSEMTNMVVLLYEELSRFGYPSDRCVFVAMDESGSSTWWLPSAVPNVGVVKCKGRLPGNPVGEALLNGYLSKAEQWHFDSGTSPKEWTKQIFSDAYQSPESFDVKGFVVSDRVAHIAAAFNTHGCLLVDFEGVLPIADRTILARFSKLFEQIYTRFLDLQKAEAQAREVQIEAALERLRSMTIGMQKSSELIGTSEVILEQLKSLGVKAFGVAFAICEHGSILVEKWTNIGVLSIPYTTEIGEARMYEAWKNQVAIHEEIYEGARIHEYYKAFTEIPAFKKGYEKMVASGLLPTWQKHYAAVFRYGYLLFITVKPFDETNIFVRFAKVFEQTYTRFLDLQRAERQAREAQVEAALEKVRSTSLSMRHSSELEQVIVALFTWLVELGLPFDNAFIIFFESERRVGQLWLAANTLERPIKIEIPFNDPILANIVSQDFVNAIDRSEHVLNKVYTGKAKDECVNYLATHNWPRTQEPPSQNAIENDWLINFATQTNSLVGLCSWAGRSLANKDFQVLKRFARVFEQAYVRYLDLQLAEAQAHEAIKRASVDRVRAEIASMRAIPDLERITPILWHELTAIGVSFIRCGVLIVEEAQQRVNVFLAAPDGSPIAVFHVPLSSPTLPDLLGYWRKKEIQKLSLGKEQFLALVTAFAKENIVAQTSQLHALIPKEKIFMNFVPFLQGMLYVGNDTPLSDADLKLVQALADSFSTAYARYEDFNKLEQAKTQVEKTLADLKQTQQLLVQREKMASLGELTAGIAHEIQNPLNFVNNFSEVSTEMIDEMLHETTAGNWQHAKEISIRLKGNLDRINNHGKRAADIVKGMLQHSRTSTGQKELTDINALCDEHLRLAYLGLRATDKTFNAKVESDYDDTLPKISIVPQDIGRVILNLLNNAFYAVTEKEKQVLATSASVTYQPTVSVSTNSVGQDDGRAIQIKIKDNGTGIPQKAIDKIFQPFFTTKPTGQGTGLGLSLGYDVVKSHGGELTVLTQEGKFTEFTIQLPAIG